jgi:hypothetical protein
MTATTQLCHRWLYRFARLTLILCCAGALLASGCASHRAKAKPFPWSTFAYTRPLAPTNAATEIGETEDPLQDIALDVEPPPSPLVIVRSAPSRPRVPVNTSAQTDTVNRPELPQIAPQLTAAETSAAQQQMTQSLSIAERNLGSAEGKQLNPTQQDLASKVRSFIAEAHDAANSGDWTRARNAAKKAEVLSQELAGSL